jgi:lauroyl/myristoyl acyltransferase
MYQTLQSFSGETRKKGCSMRYLMLTLSLCLLEGCALIAVADLAVTTAATVAKAGVKTVGAAVDLVTPDKSEKEKEKTVKK